MKKRWIKSLLAFLLVLCAALGLAACRGKDTADGKSRGAKADQEEPEAGQEEPEAGQEEPEDGQEEPEAGQTGIEDGQEETELQVFIAASLNAVMADLTGRYQQEHPNVKITCNADSSGKLLTQIEEGYECDIFFSAAQKQMDQLEADGLIIGGSRNNVVSNQLVVLTRKDSSTVVRGLESLKDAKSIALAGGSVPAGKYTRQALVALGILSETEDASRISTAEISAALGGVEISEQDNVSKVLIAVTEGACEVGTAYYSDLYGYEDQVEILERVSCDLTGDVIYPICLVENQEADEAQQMAAVQFLRYLLSEEAKAVFESYDFGTEVE